MKRVLGALAAAVGLALSGDAHADVNVHGGASGARAVLGDQAREFGFGGVLHLAAELPLSRTWGGELAATLGMLSSGDPPENPRLLGKDAGFFGGVFPGLRVRPFAHDARPSGFWVAGHLGGVGTGGHVRFAAQGSLGYDFRVGGGRLDVGPMAGYLHILQPDDTLRPEDARIVTVGLHLALGPRVEKARSKDDAPKRTPSDRDHDDIVDAEDACPDEPGRPTGDPKTHGCPRRDKDGDGVFDDEDACPVEPGVRTEDPKTNGCPRRDRDGDKVFDSDDACPDVPGVTTSDPKTNGCPEAVESVRVEKDHIVLDDKIYFETDVARVRRYSWPLVQKLAKFVQQHQEFVEISIEGHTDEVGSDEHNMILSKQRAEAVRLLLMRFGVEGTRLTSTGYGKTRPVVDGHDEGAHKQNRRVEFIITKTRVTIRTGGGDKAGAP